MTGDCVASANRAALNEAMREGGGGLHALRVPGPEVAQGGGADDEEGCPQVHCSTRCEA
jgi:hypothetical protein